MESRPALGSNCGGPGPSGVAVARRATGSAILRTRDASTDMFRAPRTECTGYQKRTAIALDLPW